MVRAFIAVSAFLKSNIVDWLLADITVLSGSS